ncbi:RNA-directed DNA polymerase, eukaryota [Tanacetum coccineum]
MDDKLVPRIIPVLFPCLHAIVSSPQNSNFMPYAISCIIEVEIKFESTHAYCIPEAQYLIMFDFQGVHEFPFLYARMFSSIAKFSSVVKHAVIDHLLYACYPGNWHECVGLCRHLHFDFHRICGHVQFERLSILYEQIEDFLIKNRYYLLSKKGEKVEGQIGIVRTNCVDRLDRTNVTQGVPCPSVPRKQKPRRVDLYYSSWFIQSGCSCFIRDGSVLLEQLKDIVGIESDQISTPMMRLRNKDVDLLSFMNKKVGNGLELIFWEEVWRGDKKFKSRFPRVYALEFDKKITVATKLNHNDVGFSLRRSPRDGVEMEQFSSLNAFLEGTVLSDSNDRWSWSLVGSGEFSVASARKYIDEHRLGGSSHKTRWIKVVPIKINILAWKIRYDFLPTRLNLSRRGIEIQSIICPSCNKEVESSNHIFFASSLVRNICQKFATWWELPYVESDSYDEWLDWLISLRMSSRNKNMLEGIFYVLWWLVWNHRNKSLFDTKNPSTAIIFDVLVSRSFFWCRYRSNAKFSRIEWMKNPNLISL